MWLPLLWSIAGSGVGLAPEGILVALGVPKGRTQRAQGEAPSGFSRQLGVCEGSDRRTVGNPAPAVFRRSGALRPPTVERGSDWDGAQIATAAGLASCVWLQSLRDWE